MPRYCRPIAESRADQWLTSLECRPCWAAAMRSVKQKRYYTSRSINCLLWHYHSHHAPVMTTPSPWPWVPPPSISTKRSAVIFIWVSGQVSTNLLENFDLHVTSVLFLQLLRHRLQVRPAAEADDGKWSCNILTKFALCFIFADWTMLTTSN